MINNYFFINFILTVIIGFFGSNYYNIWTNSTDIPNQTPIEKLETNNNKKVIQKENETLRPSFNELKQQAMRDIGHEVAEKEESFLFYTIQTGSFVTLERSRKQFDSIMQGLFKKTLDHFRIEKVGKFYSVRLGKFMEYADAEKYFQAIKPELSQAIILKAYIKDERILKKYNGDVSKGKKGNNMNENSFELITKHDLGMPSMPSIKNELKKVLPLPPNEKPLLFGTVIFSDNKLAIIEDRATKQTGLYKINDRVMDFIVSDILSDKVILKKNDGFIEIGIRDKKGIKTQTSGRKIQKYKKRRHVRTGRRTLRNSSREQ